MAFPELAVKRASNSIHSMLLQRDAGVTSECTFDASDDSLGYTLTFTFDRNSRGLGIDESGKRFAFTRPVTHLEPRHWKWMTNNTSYRFFACQAGKYRLLVNPSSGAAKEKRRERERPRGKWEAPVSGNFRNGRFSLYHCRARVRCSCHLFPTISTQLSNVKA